MCRSLSTFMAAVCFVASAIAGAGSAFAQEAVDEAIRELTRSDATADAVTNWLERHRLIDLLAVHLEEQIEATSGEQQRALILRLAGIYAEMLEAAEDPDRRELLEVRSRRLLRHAEADGAEELRMALLRASYRAAETIAEQHRLRLASHDDLLRARQTVRELVPQLQELNQQLQRSVQLLDRQLSRASGAGARTAAARMERMQLLYQQCTFLTAWVLYHDAWLNEDTRSARLAEELFARLLLSDSPRPHPDDISVDLRTTEPFARAIVGMALCRSLTATSSSTALGWIDLLSHEATFPPLREQALTWELVIRLEHREFTQALHLLEARNESQDALPLTWLRLVAVHALEAPIGARGARELVRITISQLAALGELDQILDLAERYGAEALGDSGFALRYVNGVVTYRQARDAHQGDGPAADESVLGLYQQAAEHFSAALAERDADQYAAAVGGCRRLLGWALYFQGRYADAHETFRLAEGDLPEAEAAEALWMAIVSLDELIHAGGDERVKQRQAALVQRFLSRYPGSERTPLLLLRQAIAAERIDDVTLQKLLDVPAGHASHESASRRAAQELYQRFREADGDRKLEYAAAFLYISRQLMEREAADDADVERLVLDIRRVLEVSLSGSVHRGDVARAALERYEQLVADDKVEPDTHAEELAFRRVQQRLLENDIPTATDLADRIWDRESHSTWARLAVRAVFQYAHALRPVDDAARLHLMARYGGRVIREFEDDPDALNQSQVLAYHAAVAEALRGLWEHSGESQHARAALFLYQRMLHVSPRNADFLRAAAGLATHLDEYEFAVDCWRRIAAGSQAGTDDWYEARYQLIAVLERIDPRQARSVLRQHVQLYPDYGPEPWGARMRQLAQRLEAQEGGS